MLRKFDPMTQLPTDDRTEHDGPDAGCPSAMLDLLCTRNAGHPMPHRAGATTHGTRIDVVAEWDDNRDTDGLLDAEDRTHRPQDGE